MIADLPFPKTSSRRKEPKPGRVRCEKHLARIRRLWCCVPGCRERPVQPHHLRSCDDPEAMGLRSGDDKTVPLCVTHHVGPKGVQTSPDERTWGRENGIDLEQIAAQRWQESVWLKLYVPKETK